MTENYWIGDLIAPFLGLFMVGIAFWYAYRRDQLNYIIKLQHTCDNSCHGSDEKYIYNKLTALQGVHALEQRVNKLEMHLKENK